MAKDFSKFKLSYKGELVGYFNSPLDINKEEALQLLQAIIDDVEVEEAVSNKKESVLLSILGKKTSKTKSEDF